MDKIQEYLLKIKRILTNHNSRLNILEQKVENLEADPWKMPFDNG